MEIFRSKWSTSFDWPKNRTKPHHCKPLRPPQSCACERELLNLGRSILILSPHPYMDGAHSYVTTWSFVGKSFDKSFMPALIFLVAWDQVLKTFPNLQSTTRFTLLDLLYFVFPVFCLFSPTTEPGPSLNSFENRVLPVICPGSSSIKKTWVVGWGCRIPLSMLFLRHAYTDFEKFAEMSRSCKQFFGVFVCCFWKKNI